PVYCTSTGKILTAFLTRAERDALLPASFPRLAAKTITDRETLEQALAEVRQRDYAVAVDEFADGLSAVAAPVRDHTGRVIAAVSVTGPTYRMGPEQIATFASLVKVAATRISARIGYVAWSSDDG